MLGGLRNQLAQKINSFSFLFSSAQTVRGAPQVIKVSYQDLENQNSEKLFDQIQQAYSDKGLGILLVEGVPDFQSKRVDILKNAQLLANLPQEKLQQLEAPEFHFGIGWSHGREQFNGKPDFMKVRKLSYVIIRALSTPTQSKTVFRLAVAMLPKYRVKKARSGTTSGRLRISPV